MAEFFEQVTEFFGKIGQFFSFIKQIITTFIGIFDYAKQLFNDLFGLVGELLKINPFIFSLFYLIFTAILVIIIISIWEAIT